MTVSVFAEAIDREHINGDLFFDWLRSVSYGFFETYLASEEAPKCDIGDKKRIVMYVMRAYCQESSHVISGADWEQNKLIIAETSGLTRDFYDDVVYLQNPAICDMINDYLTLQGNREFKRLQNKKDLFEAMTKKLTAESTSAPFKELRAMSNETDAMLNDIAAIEEIFRQHSKKIFEGKRDLQMSRERSSQPLGNVEDSRYIK